MKWGDTMKTITEMLKTMTPEEVVAKKPVLSVLDVEADMKYHGVKTSPSRVRAMIKNGQYPFAIWYMNKTFQCDIFTKPYIEYIDKMFGLPQKENV